MCMSHNHLIRFEDRINIRSHIQSFWEVTASVDRLTDCVMWSQSVSHTPAIASLTNLTHLNSEQFLVFWSPVSSYDSSNSVPTSFFVPHLTPRGASGFKCVVTPNIQHSTTVGPSPENIPISTDKSLVSRSRTQLFCHIAMRRRHNPAHCTHRLSNEYFTHGMSEYIRVSAIYSYSSNSWCMSKVYSLRSTMSNEWVPSTRVTHACFRRRY